MSEFSYEEDKDLSVLLHKLIDSYNRMMNHIGKINNIMNKTKLLSLNSSIEAARAGEAGRGFAVIASEIQKFSDQSRASNDESLDTMKILNHQIYNVIGLRTADVAFDLIDKIDRNLFERNCDVQAWATFDKIVECVVEATEDRISYVNALLHNLYQIYEVYHDIIMVNKDGEILSVAVNKDLIGMDVSGSEWFQNAKMKNGCSVSEMYYSKNINDYTVSYSCAIHDNSGNFIGVLSTRFNWSFIYDIIDKAKISEKGEVYVIDSKGIVIASKDKNDVLKTDLLKTYPSARKVIDGEEYGFSIESKNDQLLGIIGYAHTKGYNAYAGKNWSVVVKENF